MTNQDNIRKWKKYKLRLDKWIKHVDKYIIKLESNYERKPKKTYRQIKN